MEFLCQRFTLEHMFAMELGRYQEIAKEIVMNAVKELAIEKGLKEMTEVWKEMQFNVVKHFRGTVCLFNPAVNIRR